MQLRLPALLLAFAREPYRDDTYDEADENEAPHRRGSPPRRHGAGRRRTDRDPDEELTPEQLSAYLRWARKLYAHKALVMFVWGGITAVGGYLAATWGLAEQVEQLERRVLSLEETDVLKTGMLCTITSRLTPDQIPNRCRDYIVLPESVIPLPPRQPRTSRGSK